MLGIAVSWIHVLGIWIAILLIVFESVFFGALGVALSLTARLRSWPVAAACCWVLVEFAYSRIPFGGFGWTRLAYAAVDTPLAGFLPFVGVTGVSFLVALLPQLPAWVLIGAAGGADSWSPRPSWPSSLEAVRVSACCRPPRPPAQ